MWGGIATGIFGIPEMAAFSPDAKLTLGTQVMGTLVIAGWALGMSLALFYALKIIGQLRVSAEEELAGLDIHEHGMYAYPPQLVVETYGGTVVGSPSIGPSSAPVFAGHPQPSPGAV